jgi:hypothetical protein
MNSEAGGADGRRPSMLIKQRHIKLYSFRSLINKLRMELLLMFVSTYILFATFSGLPRSPLNESLLRFNQPAIHPISSFLSSSSR